MKDFKPHPIAEVFPIMSAAEMTEFVADVKLRGLQIPIVLYEDKILDGRHRYEACQILKITPRFKQYIGKDPLGFVISANLKRRHLTVGERAAIALAITSMKQGQRSDLEPCGNEHKVPISQAAAAKMVGVSRETVSAAKQIAAASPSTFKQMAAGKISVREAEKKVEEKQSKREPVLDEIGIHIPGDALPFWHRRQEIQDMLNQISRLKCAVEKAKLEGDCMFGKVSNATADDLKAAYVHLLEALPYAVCTQCMGVFSAQPKGCSMCGNKGLISKFQWDTQSRKEVKDMRIKVAKARAA